MCVFVCVCVRVFMYVRVCVCFRTKDCISIYNNDVLCAKATGQLRAKSKRLFPALVSPNLSSLLISLRLSSLSSSLYSSFALSGGRPLSPPLVCCGDRNRADGPHPNCTVPVCRTAWSGAVYLAAFIHYSGDTVTLRCPQL